MKLERINALVLCCVFLLGALANTSAIAATPEEIAASIEAGIEWLVAQQDPNGYFEDPCEWDGGNLGGQTGLALVKLEERALELGYDSPFDQNYPYSENVQKGLCYLFSIAKTIEIFPQAAGDPDTDGDGNGVYVASDGRHSTYETGIALMAIAASEAPDRIVNCPGSPVNGWTYKAVLQDMVDYLAFGQVDSPSPSRGGWDYTEDPSGQFWGDNSNSGYAVLGLAYAEAAGCTIPAFVKSELNVWIDFIQNDVDGDCDDGGSGYMDPNDWVNVLKTGNLIFEMAFYGDGTGVPRLQDALAYLGRFWNHHSTDPGWKGDPCDPWLPGPHYQAMYCIMKGLEFRGIDEIEVYQVPPAGDRDIFEVSGLAAGFVDIQVVLGSFWPLLGEFDAAGNLLWFSPWGMQVMPDMTGTVRFGITGDPDVQFEGDHMESGAYKIAIWPVMAPRPVGPEVSETESNDEFEQRNIFINGPELVINGNLGCTPPGEPSVIDWYAEFADAIVNTQQADGSWPRDYWGGKLLASAWALLTLEKAAPPVAEVYGQCILAGESFEPVDLDDTIDPCNPGTPPYTWEVTGNVDLTVDIDANNVMTVTYPEGWTGSETLTVTCTDAASRITKSYPTYTVCAAPIVLDIPDQTAPFEPFDLDDYLDPDCGLEPDEVEWSASEPPEGWTVEIDVNNVVTVTAPESANEPATLTFTATSTVCECAEASDSDDATFVIVINQPPDCSGAYADPACLWPPNHKMVSVSILGVTDPDEDPVTITITSITSDEATATQLGAGGPIHAPDANGVGTDTALLRAERSGRGNGRVYVINFIAIDPARARCQGSVEVRVPHDQRPSRRSPTPCDAGDDGQNYDATQIN